MSRRPRGSRPRPCRPRLRRPRRLRGPRPRRTRRLPRPQLVVTVSTKLQKSRRI